MCGTCGCGIHNGPVLIDLNNPLEETKTHDHLHGHDHHHHTHHHNLIQLETDVLQKNQLLAERNRGYFAAKNVSAFNLVSSPGSGKTSLLEKMLVKLNPEIKCYVIEGDQQSTNDAERIKATETPVIQVNTGRGCHLESEMIMNALNKLDPEQNSLLFIENVGNLVCPAMFDLGEKFRVVIMSVTEGDDKPIKYPDAFHSSHICLINKIDLLPYVDFDVAKAKEYALKVNPTLTFFEVSAITGEGLDDWIAWLKSQMDNNH